MILLRGEWKNIIAQNILKFAQENKIVNGAISIENLVGLEVRFDKFIKGDDEIKYDFCQKEAFEKRKNDEELFKDLDKSKKKILFKNIISRFFEDEVCYFRNNMIIFPARFIYKKMNKNGFFKTNTIKLVSKRNAEYTFGVVISYLYYWSKIENQEFEFVKHLQEGVVLKDKKSLYFIEFEREDFDDEKKNSSKTKINIYANNPENNSNELVKIIDLILMKKLEKVYEYKKIKVFKDEEEAGEIALEIIDKELERKIKEIKEYQFEEETKEEIDERVIFKIKEKFKEDKDKVLKLIENVFNEENSEEKKEFYFLHLSDLHFSSDEDIEKQFCLLKESLDNFKVDYIVISGDLSIKADIYEFEKSALFIEKLIEYYNLTPAKILIVPGNHDYSRVVTQEAYEVLSFRESQFNEKSDYKINDSIFLKRNNEKWNNKFENFSDYIYERIYNKTYSKDFIDFIEDYNFYFVLLNSSKHLDQFFYDEVDLDEKDLIKCYIDKIKIAIGHHPIFYMKNKEKANLFYQNLNEFGYVLYLHGHTHNNTLIQMSNFAFKTNPTVTIGAGLFNAYSKNAQPPGVPMRFNVIKIKTSNKKCETIEIEVKERGKNNEKWKEGVVYYSNGTKQNKIIIECNEN